MSKRAPLALLLALLLVPTSCDSEGTGPTATGTQGNPTPRSTTQLPTYERDGRARRALLVGVGRYSEQTAVDAKGVRVLADLTGPANDMALVRELLTRCYQFTSDEITILVDGQATLENVVQNLRKVLIDGVDADTEILIWFACHGSKVAGTDQNEATGYDNSLVMHDSRVGRNDGSRDLTDDALHSLLAASPSQHITLITDSCHSGDVSRDVDLDLVPRSVPMADGVAPEPPTQWPFWPDNVPFLDDGDSRRTEELTWVHLAACRPEEKAFEATMPGGHPLLPGVETFGLCTLTLCETLVADGTTSWEAATLQARATVLSRYPKQHMESHGPLQRRIFRAGSNPTVGGLQAVALATERFRIEGGVIHGLRPGHRGNVLDLTNGKVLGEAQVVRVDLGSAIARWLGDKAAVPAAGIALKFDPTDDAVDPIGIAAPEDAAAREWLETILEEGVARLERRAPEYRVVPRDDQFALVAPDGYQVWPDERWGQGEEAFAAACRWEAQFRWLWQTTSQADLGGLKIALEATGHSSLDSVPARLVATADPSILQLDRDPDAELAPAIRLSLKVKPKAHFVVLNLVQHQRAIRQVWPPSKKSTRSQRDRMDPRPLRLEVPPASAGAPAIDRYAVIASDRPFDTESMLGEPSRATRDRGSPPNLFDNLDERTFGLHKLDIRLLSR